MDTLLHLLDRGLQGDADALTFLERTASIYIFDGTNIRQPKTFGIWDFLNQALTEVERVESRLMQSTTQISTLVNHVQLIATIAKRAAHKTYDADRINIQICLQNAAQYHGSADQARILIESNTEMRQRVMGRIAAIVFDFSYHFVESSNPARFHSAFSHPIAVESLCALIAANTVSSSPTEVINLISDLIIPGVQYLLIEDGQQQHHLSMPPFSAAALLYHIALEAKGRTAPAGTKLILKTKLLSSVLTKVLGPILIEAVRDSDMGKERDEVNHGHSNAYTLGLFSFTSYISSSYKIASMSFKALEAWITITDASITQLILAFEESGISFIEAISEAMYSDSASVLESIASLLQVLFRQESPEVRSKQIPMYDDDAQYREHLLSEIIIAIGLQANHFIEAQRQGLLGVCHSISNIASTAAAALSPYLRAGKLPFDQCSSLIEVLALCASHRLLHICSMAINAFSSLTKLSTALAKRILQILQSRAIIPPNSVGFSSSQATYDVDLEEFELFRENVLKDVLLSCYITSRSYYIESCATAVEEFCTTSAQFCSSVALSKQKQINPQLSFQLEAALFCLSTVAEDASKRALLHGASPSVLAVAAKACESLKAFDGIPLDINMDAGKHNEQLTRCLRALAEFPILAFSNQYVLGQMCRFLHAYSSWISNTSVPGILDHAATLALKAFNHQAAFLNNGTEKDYGFRTEHGSPFSEASMALRSILKRSPQRFTNPDALATLEASWRKLYETRDDDSDSISVEDRKVFCSGICSVLIFLPPIDCGQAIAALSEPALNTIEDFLKKLEEMKQANTSTNTAAPLFAALSEEIQILSTIILSFQNHTFTCDMNKSDFSSVENKGNIKNPLQQLVQTAWPALSHIAMKYCWNDEIASSLFELLHATVSINHSGTASTSFLNEMNQMASIILDNASSNVHANTVVSLIDYVTCVIDNYGPGADEEHSLHKSSSSMPKTQLNRDIETSLYLAVNTSKLISSQTQTPDVTSAILKMFCMCMKSCPITLLNLPVIPGEQGKDGQLLARIIERALVGIAEKEVDVARQSMVFLRDLVRNCMIMSYPQEESFPSNDNIIRSSLEPLMDEIRTELIHTLLHGTCGIFPQDILESAANLFLIVIQTTSDMDTLKMKMAESLHPEFFLLGDEAKLITLKRILRCMEGKDMLSFHTTPSSLLDIFSDIWRLHQIEDKDISLVGSDDVLDFIQKYA